MRPPMEIPSTFARSSDSTSISAAVSLAISSIVYGVSGLSVRPAPRLSNAMTWKDRANQVMIEVNSVMSAPRPLMSSNGSPAPCCS